MEDKELLSPSPNRFRSSCFDFMDIISEKIFLKPKQYSKYKFILLDCSCQVAQYFKDRNINIPICQIYDLPLMMKLVYDSLIQYKHKILSKQDFEIVSVEFAKQLYVGFDLSGKSTSLTEKIKTNIAANVCKLMNYINDYQPSGKPLLHFQKKKKANCILTVYPAFLTFARTVLNNSSECLRIPLEACKELNKLRKNGRAYAFFIEKIRYFSFALLEKTAKAVPQRLKGELKNFCEKRIEVMFHFKTAKRAFYFEEIQKTAQKGLDEYGVTNEMLMNFANTSIHIENRLGISAWGTYANGNKMINDLKKMISDKTDETTIRCFINTQKATYRQRIYMENIFAQAMDNNALRVA